MKHKKLKNEYIFETKNYKMKKEYLLNTLVVANLRRVLSIGDEEDITPKSQQTNQKYIFEILPQKNGKIQYREIFTGFIASEKTQYFDVPYLADVVPLSDYYPEIANEKISYLNFLWMLNDINFTKTEKIYEKK